MELRSLLKSGHSVALGVLALRAVQSALTLAMPTGGDSPPMGWTPMPDPADSGVGSPPFPVNRALTPILAGGRGWPGCGWRRGRSADVLWILLLYLHPPVTARGVLGDSAECAGI
jgi:hypothetical protein